MNRFICTDTKQKQSSNCIIPVGVLPFVFLQMKPLDYKCTRSLLLKQVGFCLFLRICYHPKVPIWYCVICNKLSQFPPLCCDEHYLLMFLFSVLVLSLTLSFHWFVALLCSPVQCPWLAYLCTPCCEFLSFIYCSLLLCPSLGFSLYRPLTVFDYEPELQFLQWTLIIILGFGSYLVAFCLSPYVSLMFRGLIFQVCIQSYG